MPQLALPLSREFRYRFWLLLLLVAASGCGAAEYERRLQETSKYYAYLNRLDSNLFGPSTVDGSTIRIPKQFAALPPPTLAMNEDGTVAEEQPVDPRQPNYADLTLPGLIGAWTAEVPVGTTSGTERRPAYIYLLTNHSLLLSTDPTKAPQFMGDVATLLWRAFKTPEDQRKASDQESFPKSAKFYVPQNVYTVVSLQPKAPVNDVPYLVDLYGTQKGDSQGLVLVVQPASVSETEKLPERVTLLLETLKLSQTPVASAIPAAPAAGAAPGAPAAPAKPKATENVGF